MATTKDAQRLRRAAEGKGKAEDQYQLARLYYDGEEGLKQDLAAAVKWYRKAAAQKHAGAELELAGCYARGEGVEQNHALAATWVGKAADQGDARAQGYLGTCYATALGVKKNDALAVAWWEKAAVGGDAESQSNLGLTYTVGGFGLPKNAHCAKIFMMAAADNAHAQALKDLKVLRACASCGTPDASRGYQGCMSVTGLSTVRYCNPKCQKAHWKVHKADCGGRQACACHSCKSDRSETAA